MKTSLRNLICWLPWTRPAPRRRPPMPSWVGDEQPELAEDADSLPKGCGWFDSSHELRQGLAVSEQLDDTMVATMPLGDWIDWQLQGIVRGPNVSTAATA